MQYDLFKWKDEEDPTGADPHSKGAKLDAGKSPVFQGLFDYFPRACLHVADVSDVGAKKYTWKGWESVPNGYTRYSDALSRHLLKKGIEGDFDSDTMLLHDAHIAWNAMAILELKLRDLEESSGELNYA
jgi:hypothetical protein